MEHPNNGTGDSRQTLMELILGTVLWGIVICLVGIWFVSDKVVWLFSVGAGVAGAAAMAERTSSTVSGRSVSIHTDSEWERSEETRTQVALVRTSLCIILRVS